MAKFGRVVLLIVLIGVLIALIPIMQRRVFGNVERAQLKVGASVLSDDRQCQVKVTIDHPQNDVDLAVTVTAKPGIYFISDGQKAERSVTREVGTLFPQEERILTFTCFLDETVTLHSGAYVVKAVAKYQSPKAKKGDEYAKGSTLLFVELKRDPTTNEISNGFLPGADEFNELFTKPYESGAYYQYRLELADEESKPTSGLLDVRINGKEDNFAPTLYVVVSGGVAFGQPIVSDFVEEFTAAQVPIHAEGIDSGGSRIVSIPFEVVQRSIPGSYGIKVLQAGQGEAPGEMAPLYIRVTSSPESPDDLWLKADKHDDAPLLTPAPTQAS